MLINFIVAVDVNSTKSTKYKKQPNTMRIIQYLEKLFQKYHEIKRQNSELKKNDPLLNQKLEKIADLLFDKFKNQKFEEVVGLSFDPFKNQKSISDVHFKKIIQYKMKTNIETFDIDINGRFGYMNINPMHLEQIAYFATVILVKSLDPQTIDCFFDFFSNPEEKNTLMLDLKDPNLWTKKSDDDIAQYGQKIQEIIDDIENKLMVAEKNATPNLLGKKNLQEKMYKKNNKKKARYKKDVINHIKDLFKEYEENNPVFFGTNIKTILDKYSQIFKNDLCNELDLECLIQIANDITVIMAPFKNIEEFNYHMYRILEKDKALQYIPLDDKNILAELLKNNPKDGLSVFKKMITFISYQAKQYDFAYDDIVQIFYIIQAFATTEQRKELTDFFIQEIWENTKYLIKYIDSDNLHDLEYAFKQFKTESYDSFFRFSCDNKDWQILTNEWNDFKNSFKQCISWLKEGFLEEYENNALQTIYKKMDLYFQKLIKLDQEFCSEECEKLHTSAYKKLRIFDKLKQKQLILLQIIKQELEKEPKNFSILSNFIDYLELFVLDAQQKYLLKKTAHKFKYRNQEIEHKKSKEITLQELTNKWKKLKTKVENYADFLCIPLSKEEQQQKWQNLEEDVNQYFQKLSKLDKQLEQNGENSEDLKIFSKLKQKQLEFLDMTKLKSIQSPDGFSLFNTGIEKLEPLVQEAQTEFIFQKRKAEKKKQHKLFHVI